MSRKRAKTLPSEALEGLVGRMLDRKAVQELVAQGRVLLRWMTEAAKVEDVERYTQLVAAYVHIQKVIFVWATILQMGEGQASKRAGEELFAKLLDRLGLPQEPPKLVPRNVQYLAPKDADDPPF